MSKQKKRSSNTIKNLGNAPGLDSEISKTLIYSAVIIGIIVVFGALIFTSRSKPQNFGFENSDIWEKDFAKVEENRVGVVFNPITTDTETYEKIRQACNEYIEANKNKETSKIDVDVQISDEVYTDTEIPETLAEDLAENTTEDTAENTAENTEEDTTNQSESLSNTDKVETGPVYFNGALLLRYINNLGELDVVCGTLNESGKIDVYEQSELYLISNIIGFKPSADAESLHSYKGGIPEEIYATDVAKCITDLLESDTKEDETQAIKESLNYFTDSGKNTILKSKEILGIGKDDDVSVEFIGIGKSDTSKKVKDRMYIQCKINDNLVNIIVKANSNLRVFDIDII